MRALRTLLIVTLSALLLACAAIVIDGLDDDIQTSDVGVVLGSKVMPDGQPSARLQARLDAAAALYGQGWFKYLLVSGGTGKEGFSEARVMADYLAQKHQVPREVLILDEHGDTTEASAQNTALAMRSRGLTSALIITQYFHIPRSRYAFGRAGIATIHTAHAPYFELRDLYSTAREVVALPVYWLSPAGTH